MVKPYAQVRHNHPTLLGVTLKTLGVTLCFLSQGGEYHPLPVGQSEGTGVPLTPASLATFWELNDFIIIVYLSHSSISSEQELTQEAMLLSRRYTHHDPSHLTAYVTNSSQG